MIACLDKGLEGGREGDREQYLENHEWRNSHGLKEEEVRGHRQHHKEAGNNCRSKVAREDKERKKIGMTCDRSVNEVRRRTLGQETPSRSIGSSPEVSNGASVDLGLG